jgi:hypothetical protein
MVARKKTLIPIFFCIFAPQKVVKNNKKAIK